MAWLLRAAAAVVLAASMGAITVIPAQAGVGPVFKRLSFDYVASPDEFLVDICGLATTTQVHERYLITTFADGTQQVHVERSYVPADVRIPIERGAATAWYDADGRQVRLAGKPIQLIDQRTGGRTFLDAGTVIFGDPLVEHGHFDIGPGNPDISRYYCPWAA